MGGIKAIRERQNSNSTPNDGVACVTSGIVRARKVVKEELQNRAENGKETLLPSFCRQNCHTLKKPFRQLRRLTTELNSQPQSRPLQRSLRSKRFQSSYCAKVRAEAEKGWRAWGLRASGSFVPLPLPRRSIFFCSCPSFLDEPREETLATQANYNAD